VWNQYEPHGGIGCLACSGVLCKYCNAIILLLFYVYNTMSAFNLVQIFVWSRYLCLDPCFNFAVHTGCYSMPWHSTSTGLQTLVSCKVSDSSDAKRQTTHAHIAVRAIQWLEACTEVDFAVQLGHAGAASSCFLTGFPRLQGSDEWCALRLGSTPMTPDSTLNGMHTWLSMPFVEGMLSVSDVTSLTPV
jgi:hypothetical protein